MNNDKTLLLNSEYYQALNATYHFTLLDQDIESKLHAFYAEHSVNSLKFIFVTAEPKNWKSHQFYAYCWSDLKLILFSPLFLENIQDFIQSSTTDFSLLSIREKRALLHEIGHDHYQHNAQYDIRTDRGALYIGTILAILIASLFFLSKASAPVKTILMLCSAMIIAYSVKNLIILGVDKKKEYRADRFAFNHMQLSDLFLFADLVLSLCPQETVSLKNRFKRTHATLHEAGKHALNVYKKRQNSEEGITVAEHKKIKDHAFVRKNSSMIFQSLNYQRMAEGKEPLSLCDYEVFLNRYLKESAS